MHVRAVVGAAVLHQGAPLVLRIVGHEPQGVEVRSTDEDLEGQHARAPDVGRRAVVALGVEHLRREEAQAPGYALRKEQTRAARVPPARRGEPEVAQFNVGPVEEHVLGLDVAVVQVPRVQVREPVRDAPHDARRGAPYVLRPRGAGLL